MYSGSKKIQPIEEMVMELETVLRKSRAKKIHGTPKQRFLEELEESVKEVSLAKKGKIKLQSAKSFINKL